jgi:hypothetical protein
MPGLRPDVGYLRFRFRDDRLTGLQADPENAILIDSGLEVPLLRGRSSDRQGC